MSQSTIQGQHRNVLQKVAESNNGRCLYEAIHKNHTHTHTEVASFFSKIFQIYISLFDLSWIQSHFPITLFLAFPITLFLAFPILISFSVTLGIGPF